MPLAAARNTESRPPPEHVLSHPPPRPLPVFPPPSPRSGSVIIAVSLVGGFILVDLIDLLPVAPALLRFVGLFVTGWGLWR